MFPVQTLFHPDTYECTAGIIFSIINIIVLSLICRKQYLVKGQSLPEKGVPRIRICDDQFQKRCIKTRNQKQIQTPNIWIQCIEPTHKTSALSTKFLPKPCDGYNALNSLTPYRTCNNIIGHYYYYWVAAKGWLHCHCHSCHCQDYQVRGACHFEAGSPGHWTACFVGPAAPQARLHPLARLPVGRDWHSGVCGLRVGWAKASPRSPDFH